MMVLADVVKIQLRNGEEYLDLSMGWNKNSGSSDDWSLGTLGYNIKKDKLGLAVDNLDETVYELGLSGKIKEGDSIIFDATEGDGWDCGLLIWLAKIVKTDENGKPLQLEQLYDWADAYVSIPSLENIDLSLCDDCRKK